MAPRQRIVARADYEKESSTLTSDGSNNKGVATAPTRKPSTLNQTEADIARDWHDYFNLVVMPIIIATVAVNYDFSSLSGFWTTGYSGVHFWLNWATVLLYFFVDLVWVAAVPLCVKSPGVIIQHHLVAMLYMMGPVFFPQYRWFMGSLLSVEINTWFLILRRVVFKASSPVPPAIQQLVSVMFYLTWILTRCVIYPNVLLTFFQLAAERIEETGVYWHMEMSFIVTHFGLVLLNIKWTYDLFEPIVKRWLGIGAKPIVVQNGL